MADTQDSDSTRDTYRRTRDTFNEMKLEEQATFLVEATASMLARGVEEVGRIVADGLSDVFRARSHHSTEGKDSAHRPGPAEPETAQQRRPHGGHRASDSS